MTDVSAIGGGQGFRPPPQPLSADQKSLIEETLANFDAETLSEEDAQSIVQAFKDAGIKPGKELAQAVSELGFDAREIGELAGAERPNGPPPPPPQGAAQSLNTEGLQELEDILEDYDLSNLSEEDEDEILSAFEEAGLIGEQGGVLNLTV